MRRVTLIPKKNGAKELKDFRPEERLQDCFKVFY